MSVIKASYNRSVSFNPTSSTCQVIRGDSVVKVSEYKIGIALEVL